MVGYVRRLILRGSQSLVSDHAFRRIIINSGWLLGANGIGAIFGLAQGILVTRMLGVEQYGVLGVVMTFVTVINRLTSFRMSEFVIKYVSDALEASRKDQAAAVIKVAMVVEAGASVVAFLVVVFVAPLGARWFVHSSEAETLIIAYAVVIIGNLVSETATGVLQVFDKFRIQSLLTSIGRAVSLVAIIAAFFLQGGLWGILLAYLVSNIVSSVLLLMSALSETRRRLDADWWCVSFTTLNGRWRSAGKFVISTNVSGTLSLITKDSDLLWLGYFRSPAEVGYYKLAMKLVTLVFMPIRPLTQTIYPEIAKEAALRRWPRFRSLLRKGSALSAAYVIPVSLFMGVTSPWLIGFLYGREFVAAAPAFNILLVGVGLSHILIWSRPALLSLNRSDYLVKVGVVITVLKVIGALLLLPYFGYIGNAALVTGLYLLGLSLSVRTIELEIRRKDVYVDAKEAIIS